MPINPAPSLAQGKVRPTPKVSDLLFFEMRNSDIPAYDRPPEYGTPHPDKNKFPHHRLVFVEGSDTEGYYRWWYAADRADQDDYNFSISYPYGGDEAFPRYTRTYVMRRDEYVSLAMGSADPVHGDASLVAQQMKPMDGQIGTLYVEVTRVYDVIPGHDDSEGLGTTQTGGGYVVERPLGTLGYLKLTWTLTLPKDVAEDATSDGRSDYRQCPISGYTDLKLIDEIITSPEDQEVTRTIRRVYMKEQTAPKVDRQRLTQHLEPPDQFADFIQRETADQIVLADVADTPSSWDTTPAGTSQIQSQVEMRTLLDGRKVTVTTQYEYGTLNELAWDQNLGQRLLTERILVPASTDISAWATTNITARQFYEVRPINRAWSIITRTTMPVEGQLVPVGGGAAGWTVNNAALDYYGTRVHSWPAVLTAYNQQTYTDAEGNGVTVVSPIYKDAWSGICRSRVRRWWQSTDPDIDPIETLTPTAIELDWPIAKVSIAPCLHGAATFNGNTSSESPYGLQTFGPVTFPATQIRKSGLLEPMTDWPPSLIVEFDVVPYRHGYLCTLVDVFKPY